MPDSLIQLQDVSLGYDRQSVLSGVSLTINPLDFWIFQGPNGGGKTTLLRLLTGLSAPDAGRVLRRPGLRLGYLPQYRSIDRQFPVTVLEVVRSGLANQKSLFRRFSREADRQAMDTLSTLGLDHLAARPIDSLSGGQWQRTLLGRALVSRPELLLLDEPDTHLDALHRQQLYDTLTQQRPNMAIVVVSHDEALSSIFPNSHRLMVENGGVQEL